MPIGEIIRFERTRCKLTLEELARKVGVSRQTIQRYETGVISNIPSDKIERMADTLGVSPGHLMGWDNGNPQAQIENAPTAECDEGLKEFVQGFKRLSKTDRTVILGAMDRLEAGRSNQESDNDPQD